MRKIFIAVLLALPVVAFAAGPQTVVLDVQQMTSALCSVTLKKALEKVPGVAEAKIDYDHKTATVKFDPEKANAAVLVKAITDAGFPATPHSSKPTATAVSVESVLTCPRCGLSKQETMPGNACQFFYECEGCKALLRPERGDCCVFCSYGSVKCPPFQAQRSCCG